MLIKKHNMLSSFQNFKRAHISNLRFPLITLLCLCIVWEFPFYRVHIMDKNDEAKWIVSSHVLEILLKNNENNCRKL